MRKKRRVWGNLARRKKKKKDGFGGSVSRPDLFRDGKRRVKRKGHSTGRCSSGIPKEGRGKDGKKKKRKEGGKREKTEGT